VFIIIHNSSFSCQTSTNSQHINTWLCFRKTRLLKLASIDLHLSYYLLWVHTTMHIIISISHNLIWQGKFKYLSILLLAWAKICSLGWEWFFPKRKSSCLNKSKPENTPKIYPIFAWVKFFLAQAKMGPRVPHLFILFSFERELFRLSEICKKNYTIQPNFIVYESNKNNFNNSFTSRVTYTISTIQINQFFRFKQNIYHKSFISKSIYSHFISNNILHYS